MVNRESQKHRRMVPVLGAAAFALNDSLLTILD
jgi:hypothetical protein